MDLNNKDLNKKDRNNKVRNSRGRNNKDLNNKDLNGEDYNGKDCNNGHSNSEPSGKRSRHHSCSKVQPIRSDLSGTKAAATDKAGNNDRGRAGGNRIPARSSGPATAASTTRKPAGNARPGDPEARRSRSPSTHRRTGGTEVKHPLPESPRAAVAQLRPSQPGRGHHDGRGRDGTAACTQGKAGQNPLEIVTTTLHYFEQHFSDAIGNDEIAAAIGVSEQALACSFDQVRGMTPAQALLEHRLNRLFHTLTDQPRQGLGRAIHSCGLGGTRNVVTLFERTFGIEMALFLLTCRRAAEDRLFRHQHPEAEALVLPS